MLTSVAVASHGLYFLINLPYYIAHADLEAQG